MMVLGDSGLCRITLQNDFYTRVHQCVLRVQHKQVSLHVFASPQPRDLEATENAGKRVMTSEVGAPATMCRSQGLGSRSRDTGRRKIPSQSIGGANAVTKSRSLIQFVVV